MNLDKTTFAYLKPTDEQLQTMERCRDAVARCAQELNDLLPEGPDKTYAIRKLREVGMWANVTVTRQPDGSPRIDETSPA